MSVSTHQDKRPVRSIGNINAKEYVLGPRTIAGSLVFAVFDRHFATEIMNDLGSSMLPDEIPAMNFTINFMNEYGRKSRMAIYGVKIINEGQVMSVNDLYTENTYQFVALGMEVLTCDVDSNSINASDRGERVISYTSRKLFEKSATPENKGGNKLSEGKAIADRIMNNKNIANEKKQEDNIILSCSVEQPLTKDDLGIANLKLTGATENGTIYVNDQSGSVNLYRIATSTNRTKYPKELPVGNYHAVFKSLSNKSSNEVKFSIYVNNEDSNAQAGTGGFLPNNNSLLPLVTFYDKEAIPIIESVTDTTIKLKNNNTFTHVNYFKDGSNKITKALGSKNYVLLENLDANTKYYIYYSKNDTDKNSSEIHSSLTVDVKTHATIIETLNILISNVIFNQNLLYFDLDILIGFLNEIDMRNYDNLIDAVLDLDIEAEKQELLIYAEFVVNSLIKEYNKKANHFITEKEQNTPFDSNSVFDNVTKYSVFKNKNGKSLFSEEITIGEDEFCAIPNLRYSLYGEDFIDSYSRLDYIICKPTQYENLISYCDVNKYKKLDLTNIENKYQIIDRDTNLLLAIRDSNNSDLSILEEPYVFVEEDEYIVDVDYIFLDDNEEYYLVISESLKALDHCPRKKIKFNSSTNRINLNAHYCGIIKKETYLLWIEDKNMKKISRSHIFVPDEKDKRCLDLQNLTSSELENRINNLKSRFLTIYNNRPIIDDIFSLTRSQAYSKSNLDILLINELINICTKSYCESDTLSVLGLLLAILFDYRKESDLKVSINKNERTIIIDERDEYKVYGISLEQDEKGFTRIHKENNKYYYNEDGFSIFFICDEYSLPLGFVIIDNYRNKNMYYNTARVKEV